MSDDVGATFRAGRNIAMKVPPHQFGATVAFYRDILGLPQQASHENSASFSFGEMRLWVDPVPSLSQAEIWLEVQSDDTGKASAVLSTLGVTRCDDIEPLPEGFDGFWITNPAGIVHLVADAEESANQAGGSNSEVT